MNLDISRVMAEAKKTMTDAGFQKAAGALIEAKNKAREEIQKITAPEITKIIKKLQTQQPLSTHETTLMQTWITGDAQGYTQMENNLPDWLAEYQRLTAVLSDFENKNCTVSEALQLQGILEDAARVSYDIANFLEKQDRIKKFNAAVADGLDPNEREVLVKVLTDKLRSDNR